MAKIIPDQTILANDFSKSYAMTGWRIGYLCAPAKVTDLLFKVHAFAVTDIATFVQNAACRSRFKGWGRGNKGNGRLIY